MLLILFGKQQIIYNSIYYAAYYIVLRGVIAHFLELFGIVYIIH